MSRRVIALLVLVCVAVIVFLAIEAFGGSSSKDSSTTTNSNAVSWATTVCTALNAWVGDLRAAATQVRTNPTRAGVQDAVVSAQQSTSQTTTILKDLGPPQTEAETKVKTTLQQLKQQLESGITSIQNDVGNVSGVQGSLEAVSKVSATLVTMKNQLTASVNSLRNLPQGELRDAFATSPPCVSLKQEVS